MDEQQILAIIQKYFHPRVDELPWGLPIVGDHSPFWDKRNGILKRFDFAAILPQSTPVTMQWEWVPNRQDELGAPLPYNLNDVVTYGGKIFQSLVANNTSTPGAPNNVNWNLLTRVYSGGWYKPGVYADEKVAVFSDHTGVTQLYELVSETRPFISTNIATEEAQGIWRSLTARKQRVEVDTTTGEINFNFAGSDEMRFAGSDVIIEPTIWDFLNIEKAVLGDFIFTVGTLAYIQMPEYVTMTTPLYDDLTQRWTPADVGTYKATFDFDLEGNLFVQIFGPFKGGSNQMPVIFDNTISLNAGLLDGPRTYFDPEGDLENNPLPEVRDLVIAGGEFPDDILVATWTFFSPSGYAAGAHRYQWYKQNEDGSNRVAIPGQITNSYTIVEADIGFAITVDVVAVQTALAPANGNPESLPVTSNGILAKEETEMAELDLATQYNHYMKLGQWDDVNKRYPDLGTSGGANFFAAPVGKEPVLNGNGSLHYDPTASQKVLRFPIIAGDASRTHEFVGVFKITNLNANRTIFSAVGNVQLIFQGSNKKPFVAFNGNVFPDFVAVVDTWYAFRLRLSTTGTRFRARLQINKDVVAGTYLFDSELEHATSNGTTWSAQSGAVGATTAEGNGMFGDIGEWAAKINSHLDPALEDQLWTRLNNIKALM